MIRNPFRALGPAEMLQRQLEDALKQRIENQATLEEFQHNVTMLNARIARIRREIQAMNTETQEESRQ
jgi:Txe/YoeB family toxin of Txe-Axe toxin-antitoxin module